MSYIYLMKSYLGGGHLGFAQLYWLRLQKDCRLGGAFQAHESLLPYGYLFASDIFGKTTEDSETDMDIKNGTHCL